MAENKILIIYGKQAYPEEYYRREAHSYSEYVLGEINTTEMI